MGEILKKINTQYGLNISSSEMVDKGFLSKNYILTGETTKYFLKKYRFNKEEKIQEIHAAKQYFADGGIPVILPIVNNVGQTYFSFEDGYYAIFPCINGRHIERGNLTEAATISLGEMLGKMHLRSKKSTLSIQDHFNGWDEGKFIAQAEQLISIINAKEKLDEFDINALEGIHIRKELIQANTVTFEDLAIPNNCLIQGDYHDENVFFDENDHVQYVFDFEKVSYAPRVFELIRSMMYMFFNETLEIQRIELARLYIEVYSKMYPISKEELQKGLKLHYLRQLHSFWVESEHYINKNYRVDQFLVGKYKSTQYLSKNLNVLADKLFT